MVDELSEDHGDIGRRGEPPSRWCEANEDKTLVGSMRRDSKERLLGEVEKPWCFHCSSVPTIPLPGMYGEPTWGAFLLKSGITVSLRSSGASFKINAILG